MRSTNKVDRPFSSCLKPLFQSEAKCAAIDTKVIFCCHANKTDFHNNGLAFSLVSKLGVFGTRKWPIRIAPFQHFFTWERKQEQQSKLTWIPQMLKFFSQPSHISDHPFLNLRLDRKWTEKSASLHAAQKALDLKYLFRWREIHLRRTLLRPERQQKKLSLKHSFNCLLYKKTIQEIALKSAFVVKRLTKI